MKWNSVKDGKPTKPCRVWVIHEEYYAWQPITAYYDISLDTFTFSPYNDMAPTTIALDITHWIETPEPPK